jgi:hypothetical protein
MLFITMGLFVVQVPGYSQTIDKSSLYDVVRIEDEEHEGFMRLLLAGDEIIDEILNKLNLVDLQVEYDGDQISIGWRIMWQNQEYEKP